MTVIVKHNKTNTITDWTQAQLDEQIALGNFPSGTTLANIVLPSDWNNDHTLTGLGTMAEQDATAVAITGGTINNTTIGATTANTGAFTTLTTSGTATIADTSTVGQFGVKLAPNFAAGSSWDSKVSLFGNVNLATGAGSGAFGVAFDTTQGSSLMSIAPAVAWYNMQYLGNTHRFFGLGIEQLRITPIGSSVNFHNFSGSTTTKALTYIASGSDTNISMAFQPKGTGAIDLAAGSSGVNISNGGTVTAITRTATGSGYTSIPTIAVSAPTTAGGVQAVVTQASMAVGAVAINNGGTGYTVGNTLTVTGGTGGNCTITVSTVSSGVITGITFATTAPYTVLPTNPVSVTGGSGSSATFNLTYGISGTFTISNAGSGYIEQPTITFSGGGGSGAAAYATVGSATIIKTLGSTSASTGFSLQTPAGEQVRISDPGATTVNYLAMWGGGAGTAPRFVARGSDTDVSLLYSAKGAGSHVFRTNDTNQTQMQISHTASAVNYVQVTGGATGNRPTISAQGSDTNIDLALTPKGTGGIVGNVNSGTFTINRDSANNAIKFTAPNGNMYVQTTGGGVILFNTADGSAYQMRVNHTASAVNYVQVTGGATGNSPAVSVAGSDANLDLTLTPKGTGLIRFGTYVAGALLATGYINIKAADGTTYKVLVST